MNESTPITKVLFVSTGLNVGGAERMLVKISRELVLRKIDCKVVSLKGKGKLAAELENSGVDVLGLDLRSPAAAFRSWRDLTQLVRRFRPAVIQGWMYHGNFAASVIVKFLSPDARLCWGIRGALHDIETLKWRTRRLIFFLGRMSGSVKHVIYNSYSSASQHEAIGYEPRRSIVIPNSFDVAFLNQPVSENIRRALNIPEDAFVFLSLGRYHLVKGHADLIRAFSVLLDRLPNTFLLFVGRGFGEKRVGAIHTNASRKAASRILCQGEVDDVRPYLASADALVCSSKSESFPNAIGEAMAVGLPIVGTDVGDIKSLVGRAGRVVPVGDISALGQAMLSLIEMPKEQRRKLGQVARNSIEERFTIKKVVNKYWDCYAK